MTRNVDLIELKARFVFIVIGLVERGGKYKVKRGLLGER